jgi:glycerophosphoryl diester phosphodiesterase
VPNPLLDLLSRPVIGHRGASAYAPENTLAAFHRAAELGVDAFELDVRASRDGVAVVFHDPVLDRTTDQRGAVAARTAAQLKSVDAGCRFSGDGGRTFPWRGLGVRIPTLREVITAFPSMPLLIEIKERAVQDAVAMVLLETGAVARAVVAGNDSRALGAFLNPPFTLGASRRDIVRLFFGAGSPNPACRCYAVPDRYYFLTVPSPRFVRRARGRNSTVHVWTVDDGSTALRLWNNGVNGIVTNKPDIILNARPS